jgi:hypothetical protein
MATPWNDIGVAGMVYTAAWLEHTVGMEVVSIGRSAQNATTKEDCVLELDGSQLFIRIAIRSGWIWLYGCGQDEPSDQLQFLFNTGDGPQGWTTMRKFVQALERSGIKSLRSRPIQLGEVGSADAFVIG